MNFVNYSCELWQFHTWNLPPENHGIAKWCWEIARNKGFCQEFCRIRRNVMIEVHLFRLFFQFWKRSFASLIAQHRANSRMMSNHILTVIEKYLPKVRTKRVKMAKWGADFGKESCLGGHFGLLNTQNSPKMFVKFAPTSLKIAQNSPKSSRSPHQKPPKLSCFMENVDFVDKMFPLFAPRYDKFSQSSHHVTKSFPKVRTRECKYVVLSKVE